MNKKQTLAQYRKASYVKNDGFINKPHCGPYTRIPKIACVYIGLDSDGDTYIGATTDLYTRYGLHRANGNFFTSGIIFFETKGNDARQAIESFLIKRYRPALKNQYDNKMKGCDLRIVEKAQEEIQQTELFQSLDKIMMLEVQLNNIKKNRSEFFKLTASNVLAA